MLKRLLQRRRARSSQRINSRLANPECLETRTMLTANPVGDALLVSDLFSGTQRHEITSIDALVSGEQQATIVFHGQGVAGARLAGTDREIFFRQFNDNVAEGGLRTANQITRGEQFSPKTDVAEDGSFWVAWSGRGVGDRVGIYARRFDAGGTALSDQIRVNVTRGGEQLRPDVSVAADGSAIVVWEGVGAGDFDGVFVQRVSADGTLIGSETLVNQTTDNMQAYPVVAANSDGSFVVAWSSRQQDGDAWGVFARRFGASAVAQGDEFQVNTTVTGSQHRPAIDADANGGFVVTWSSLGQADGDSWDVVGRQFDATGTPLGGEISINNTTVGQQRDVSIAVSDAGEFLVAWNEGQTDGSGWEVMARTFNEDGAPDGEGLTVNESFSGPDSGHQIAPAVALNGFGNSVVAFEGNGTGDHAGVFAQAFAVDVAPAENLPPSAEPISDSTAFVGDMLTFTVVATDPNRADELTFALDPDQTSATGAQLTDNGDNTATVVWTPTPADRQSELRNKTFRVVVTDNGDPPMADSVIWTVNVANAIPVVDLNVDSEIVLERGESSISVGNSQLAITDGDQDELQGATVLLRGVVDTGQESLSVETAGTSIEAEFNSASSVLTLTGANTHAAYEQVLSTLTYTNTAGEARGSGLRNLDVRVSDDEDDSLVVTATVRVLALNEAPELQEIGDQPLLAGSPLHVPLDGFDLDGDALTYTVTSSNPGLVTASVLDGNRSWRMNVSSPGNGIEGQMVFELFEGRAFRATERIITLSADDFYDGLTFHRILNNFVIQGGDPAGNGTGGSELDDFDDQFHVDLQHNRTGLLSMAKSFDDTNNSQFFVTEGPSRSLDGNHTIFGLLVEGEVTRALVSDVPANSSGVPESTVFISSAEIFVDNENGVLLLAAPEGASGSSVITVSVNDGSRTVSRSFTVDVTPDVNNASPWLGDIPTIVTAVDTPTTFQLPGVDIEGDPIIYFGPAEAAPLSEGFPVELPPAGLEVSVNESGLMTVTPTDGISGTFDVTVGVSNVNFRVQDFQTIQIQVG